MIMNHIVLFEPEIPQNTGNIIRTCAATNMKLHLIEPLGFHLNTKFVKRSSVNHLDEVDMKVYVDWEAFVSENPGRYYYFTRYGQKPHSEANFNIQEDVYLIFGKESTGIPKKILQSDLDQCFRLPMTDKVRSLNLSNTVAVVAYEALRQQGYPNLYHHEPDTLKGRDYLLKGEGNVE
jgi:tRNA (cytidine/uridine-2'-O-)-methyltransferase